MSTQRIWTDAKAEQEFWQLMQRYEAARGRPGRPALILGAGLLGTLTLAGLRGRLAIRRSGRIEARAQALVDRFTVPAAEHLAPAAILVPEAPATRTHSALLIAATLANDTGPGAARGPGDPEAGDPGAAVVAHARS